jgi:2-polyprenyl-3-methyl-5-hydroxy-6-metoxy-1,4-benzoquinol methylase
MSPTLKEVTKMTAATSRRTKHWDALYEDRGIEGVSWFQPFPQMSLDLIERLRLKPSASIIDVGGGASRLVDKLLARGYSELTVLDLSESALSEAKKRLGANDVTWLRRDVLGWKPDQQYDVWHDRGVFHFLIEQSERDAYLHSLGLALIPGGSVVIGTFAENGPEQCSGLPVARYSGDALAGALGVGFDVAETRREVHVTPQGTRQAFTWVVATADSGQPTQ